MKTRLLIIITTSVTLAIILASHTAIHDYYAYSAPLNNFVIYPDTFFDANEKFVEISGQKDSGCITIKMNYFCYPKPRMYEKGGVSYLFSNTTKINGEIHFDRINGGEFYFTIKNMTRTNDGVSITFQDRNYRVSGDNKGIIYDIKSHFEYAAAVKKFDTFIAKCDNYEGTSVTLVQYLGITAIDGIDYFMTWHVNANSDSGITCDYPQVIEYSIGHNFGEI
jgi:hypothetical protein